MNTLLCISFCDMYLYHVVVVRTPSGNVRCRLTAHLIILSLQNSYISLKPGLFPPVSSLSPSLTLISLSSLILFSSKCQKVSSAAIPYFSMHGQCPIFFLVVWKIDSKTYKPNVIFTCLMNCIGYQCCLQRTAIFFRSLIPVYFIEPIHI